MEQIAENLWILRYPLKLLGIEIGRNVTVIRLRNGGLVLHSTAPFTPADVAAIRQLGDPKGDGIANRDPGRTASRVGRRVGNQED